MKKQSQPQSAPIPEKYIQNAITDLLDIIGIVYSVTDSSRAFGPDGRPRKSKVRAGWPDISMILPPIGSAAFFEVKTKKGRHREAQKDMLDLLKAQGAFVGSPRSLDDAVRLLKIWLMDNSKPLKELVRMKL